MSLRKRLRDAAFAFRKGLPPSIFDPVPFKFESTKLQTTEMASTITRDIYSMVPEACILESLAEQIGHALLQNNLISIKVTSSLEPFACKQTYTARVRVVIPPDATERRKEELRLGDWVFTQTEKGTQFRYCGDERNKKEDSK